MSALARKIGFFYAMGPRYALSRARSAILRPKLRLHRHLPLFAGNGLEIGGPSRIFTPHDLLPIYAVAANVDNVTYSERTAWEGDVTPGATFLFNAQKPPGRQFVMEGGRTESLPPASYDFIASSHMLEHAANPLAVLHGWRKLLRESAHLLLVLPHRDGTFDHRRPVTTLAHLREDLEQDVDERDQTHFAEILRLHDRRRDPVHRSRQEFERWILDNHVNRGAHHHVFDTHLAVQMLDAAGFQLIDVEPVRPWHVFLLAAKTSRIGNSSFLQTRSALYRHSPFKSDRMLNR